MKLVPGIGLVVVGFAIGVVATYRHSPSTPPSPDRSVASNGGPGSRPTLSNELVQPQDDPTTRKPGVAETIRRAKGGAYRLDLELPHIARKIREKEERWLERFRTNDGPLYDKLLADFGVDPDTRREIIDHATKVMEAKFEMGVMTTQLLNAQVEYDQRIKQVLGPKYADYIAYENSRPYRNEANLLAEFAEKTGSPLSDDRLAQIQFHMQEQGAISERTAGSMGGPYDEGPKQAIGAEKVIPLLEKRQATLSLSARAVVEQARAAGFSPREIETLEAYYRNQVEFYDNLIDNAQPASPRQIARLEAMIAELRRTPSTPPREIQKLSEKLAWMRAQPPPPEVGP